MLTGNYGLVTPKYTKGNSSIILPPDDPDDPDGGGLPPPPPPENEIVDGYTYSPPPVKCAGVSYHYKYFPGRVCYPDYNFVDPNYQRDNPAVSNSGKWWVDCNYALSTIAQGDAGDGTSGFRAFYAPFWYAPCMTQSNCYISVYFGTVGSNSDGTKWQSIRMQNTAPYGFQLVQKQRWYTHVASVQQYAMYHNRLNGQNHTARGFLSSTTGGKQWVCHIPLYMPDLVPGMNRVRIAINCPARRTYFHMRAIKTYIPEGHTFAEKLPETEAGKCLADPTWLPIIQGTAPLDVFPYGSPGVNENPLLLDSNYTTQRPTQGSGIWQKDYSGPAGVVVPWTGSSVIHHWPVTCAGRGDGWIALQDSTTDPTLPSLLQDSTRWDFYTDRFQPGAMSTTRRPKGFVLYPTSPLTGGAMMLSLIFFTRTNEIKPEEYNLEGASQFTCPQGGFSFGNDAPGNPSEIRGTPRSNALPVNMGAGIYLWTNSIP